MATYKLKYYAEIQNYRGQLARVEIYRRGATSFTALQIGNICGLVLEIQGGTEDIITPIVKTQLRLSMIDTDKPTEDGVKYGGWQEFYTPDDTLYKVVLKTKASASASSWTTRWSGYITPDSWQESLEYGGAITIVARDNIGHLQDFEFDMTPDTNGLVKIRTLIQAAMEKVSMPMTLKFLGDGENAGNLEADQVYLLDAYISASHFSGDSWDSVLEDVLDSIGYTLRFTDLDTVTIAPLRYLPNLGEEDTQGQPQMSDLEFYNGTGELVPAAKSVMETHQFDYNDSALIPIKGNISYASATNYRCKVEGNKMPGGGTFSIPEHDAAMTKVTGGGGTAWATGSDLLNPDYFVSGPKPWGGRTDQHFYRDYVLLAANGVNTSKRTQTLEFFCNTANVTLKAVFHENPVVADIRNSGGNQIIECDDVGMTLYQIRYVVAYIKDGQTKYWNNGNWIDSVKELTAEYDSQNERATELNVVLKACDLGNGGILQFSFTDIQYKMFYGGGVGVYARLDSFQVTANGSHLGKSTIKTVNNEAYNVKFEREPKIAPLTRDVEWALASNYPSILYYYDNGQLKTYPYLCHWDLRTTDPEKPLALMIHQQLLCYYGATLWVLSGECAPQGKQLFWLNSICHYKGRNFILQSGTLDFMSGTVESAIIREFIDYDDIWDDTQEGTWTIKGESSNESGGTGGTSSNMEDVQEWVNEQGYTTHTHANLDTLDLLTIDDGYLMVGDEKATVGEADHAADSDHADEADHAADSDKWENHDFDDYLDQPVRTTDDVQFKDVDAEDVTAENVTASTKVVTPDLESPDFVSGPLGAGFRLKNMAGGNAALELDELTVRKTMKVYELIIQQIKHQGGMVIYSAASLICSRVEELENGYKCYFDTEENEQGDAQIPNEFVVGDQARCQRFNLAATGAKYYWRLVTAVGDDYIVLSKTDCDAGSGVPAIGDNIVQLGHRTNTARQSAKITTCIDSQSPRDDYYKGINSYDLTGTLITTVGVKDNKVGIWTKDGSFEGVVTIKGGSGLETLDEWNAVSQSITNAQAAANKALAAIADINSDTVLDPSEKNTIRTEWITINGIEALDRVGARGSYSITKALFAKYQDIGGQLRLDYNGHVYTQGGIVYTYSAVGVAALDAAYEALREYLNQVQLNNRADSYDGFDRARYSELLTTYYDAELNVNDKINQALQKQIKDTKAELLADLGDFETAVESSLEEMQGIIDNTIETWFYDGVPTLNNLPASAWTTDELLARHLGDLYYNQSTGIAYRFQRSGSEGSYTYYWYTIPDSAVAAALAAAAAAQDTADHKRRVFRSQPTNADAYDPGDVWLHATYSTTYNDEMLVCKTAKAAGVAFSIAHWETATKYTDDTVANQAVADAAAAQGTANQAVLDAAAAQSAADNAQADASAANTRLNNWANDGKISPTEKTALKQQQKDVQTEYTEICAEATRYNVSTTAYASAYTAANTALSKYTASSPENITIESDYANIAAYYDARNTILQAIAAAAKKVADDAQDAADAAQSAADAAQDAADAAQSAADAAQSAADAAQSTADSAYSIATAARDRLTNWASDNYISPQEKTALKQQQKDIQTEYSEIIADATRYGISTTTYVAAYTAANTALNKYTAATPENITVASDYDNIAAYYDARTTILAQIATAAKKVATDAQAAADKALEIIADINSDSVLDPSEKASVRATWVGINGNESLISVGADGTYAAAKKMIRELKETEMSTKLVYGSTSQKIYTFNGKALTFGNYGEAQLDAAYVNLQEFLRHCELHLETPYYGFSRSEYAVLLRDYDTALVNVQRLYTDMAKKAAEDSSLDAIAKNLGYTSFAEMETAARAGETIVEGGYIRTDLINVATLIAKRLSTTDENSLKSLTIQDNQIKLYDANGALRTHIHANALSTPATNTQEVFSPGLVNFTGLGMVDEFIRASATLFNFVASSGNDTIQGSNLIAVDFNLRLELSQKSFADFDVDVAAKLKINGTTWQSNSLGLSVIGEGSHVLIQQTIHLDPSTARALSSAGAKDVSIEVEVEPQHGLAAITDSVYGSVSFSSVDYTVTHVSSTPQITEVGIDGIQVVRSGSEYAQLHDNNGSLEFKIITGSYGLRVNSSGVQKTTNGGSSWTNI